MRSLVAFFVAAGFSALVAGEAAADTASIVFANVPLAASVNPYRVAPDFTGGVWVTDRQHRTVNHVVGDFNGDGIPDIIVPPPSASGTLVIPESIATSPNGNVAFTFNTTALDGSPLESDVGVFNASKPSKVTVYAMPPNANVVLSQDTCANADCALTFTPDGTRIWVVEQNVDKVALINTSSPTVRVFNLSPNSYPLAIAASPDGSAFAAEYFGGAAGRIAQISPSGSVTETMFPVYPGGDRPQEVAFRVEDGLLYVGTSADGLVTMSSTLQFTRTPLPTSKTQISSLIEGPDSNIWWTGFGSKTIGQWIPPSGPMSQIDVGDGPVNLVFSGDNAYYGGFQAGSFDGTLHKGTYQVASRPKIKVVKTHADNVIPAGPADVQITYTITLTNTGDAETHGPMFVLDDFPLGYVALPPPGCTVNGVKGQPGATISCLFGKSLGPGESSFVTFTAEVPLPAAGSAVRNTALFTGGGAPQAASNEDVYGPSTRHRPARH